MSKLGDEPAYPVGDQSRHPLLTGLTKRERACIDLRIPESGNEELDELIVKARRRDVAARAMQGMLAHQLHRHSILKSESADTAMRAASYAVVLLAELAKENGDAR